MAETAPRSWSDIPLELAGLIICRLPAHVHRVRFAAVRSQWRVAAREAALPPPLPLLAFRGGTVYSLPGSEPFRLPACEGYTSACDSWLVFSRKDGYFLKDPFSNKTMTLPSLSRARVRYVGDELGSSWMEYQDVKKLTSFKVLFCSPHLIASSIWFQGSSRIAVCQPGAFSWWSIHLDDRSLNFGDITFHQGRLYALDHCRGDLFSVDISTDHSTGDPWVSQVQLVVNGSMPQGPTGTPDYSVIKMLYLVQLRDGLLAVQRSMSYRRMRTTSEMMPCSYRNKFEVFQADFRQSQWSKVTTIGDDQVLFVRRHCCISACISQYKMPGDRIFFLENVDKVIMGNCDDETLFYEESMGPCRVFNLRDGKVSDLLPTVSWNHSTKRATWLFPQGQE